MVWYGHQATERIGRPSIILAPRGPNVGHGSRTPEGSPPAGATEGLRDSRTARTSYSGIRYCDETARQRGRCDFDIGTTSSGYRLGSSPALDHLERITPDVRGTPMARKKPKPNPESPASPVAPSPAREPPAVPAGFTLRHILQGHTDWIGRIAWSPDGRLLATPSADRTVRVWNAGTGQTVLTLQGHTNAVIAVSWEPNGRLLASGGDDGTVRVWDADTGHPVRNPMEHTGDVKSVSWSSHGRHLASAGVGQTIRVWDAATGQSVHTILEHSGHVNSVSWSPDGSSWPRRRTIAPSGCGGPAPTNPFARLRGIPTGSAACLGRETDSSWPLPQQTTPSACGRHSPASPSAPYTGTRARSTACRGRRTAGSWHPRAAIAQSGYGERIRGRRWAESPNRRRPSGRRA